MRSLENVPCFSFGAVSGAPLFDSFVGGWSAFEEQKQVVKGLRKRRMTFMAGGERHWVDAEAVLNPLGGVRWAVMGWLDDQREGVNNQPWLILISQVV